MNRLTRATRRLVTRVKRALCRLGFHRWTRWVVDELAYVDITHDTSTGGFKITYSQLTKRRCRRCQRAEHHFTRIT